MKEALPCSEAKEQQSTGKAVETKPTLTSFNNSCFQVFCLNPAISQGYFCLLSKKQKKQLQKGADLPLQQYFLIAGGMYPFFFRKPYLILGRPFYDKTSFFLYPTKKFISCSRNFAILKVSKSTTRRCGLNRALPRLVGEQYHIPFNCNQTAPRNPFHVTVPILETHKILHLERRLYIITLFRASKFKQI